MHRTVSLAAFSVLITASNTHAASIDLKTLTPYYNNGTHFVEGVPAGWTNVQQANFLGISNGISLTDGPHNQIHLGDIGNFVATITISAGVTSDFTGTFGGFYADFSNGFFGLSFSGNSLAQSYQFDNQTYQYLQGPNYAAASLDLQLIKLGNEFTAAYSVDGVDYNVVYQLSGLTGDVGFDLTSYGGGTGETANFTNFNISNVPLPAAFPLMCSAIVGFLGVSHCKRRWSKHA